MKFLMKHSLPPLVALFLVFIMFVSLKPDTPVVIELLGTRVVRLKLNDYIPLKQPYNYAVAIAASLGFGGVCAYSANQFGLLDRFKK